VSCSNNCATIKSYTVLLLETGSGNIPLAPDKIIVHMWPHGDKET